jgi:putative spermidine/putrescine transport system substrate-binding protein/spermidine/putrescine transport system substrate-binding protein
LAAIKIVASLNICEKSFSPQGRRTAMSTILNGSLNRRQALAAGAAALAMPFIARSAFAARELRIFTWEGYGEPQWVGPFEEKTGAKAKIAYTLSVDEMFAKMQASKGGDYDVIAFDTSMFKRYIDDGLVQPIDVGRIPNAANLVPAFQHVAPIRRGDKQYGMPFAWGSIPLIYDKGTFPAAPESWEVMWDPQYSQQMIALDDTNNYLVTVAIALGIKDPFNWTDSDFDLVKKKAIEQKALLLTYYNGNDGGVDIFASSGIKLMLSAGEPQLPALVKRGVNAGLTIPKEGAIGWLDNWTITAGATDLDLAHAWIDVCLDKSVGAALSDKAHYGNVTDQAANERNGYTYGDRLVWLQSPEDWNRRVKLWNEIKAS